MRNVQSWQLTKCIFMETDDFYHIVSDLFGKDWTVAFSLDGLSIYKDKTIDDGNDISCEDISSETLHKELANYFDVAEVTSVHMDDCDEVGVWIAYKDKPKYLILANNADAQDLSVYLSEGSEEDCFKKMQALILNTASNAGNQQVFSLECLSGTKEGNIIYTDDNTESFRYIELSKVTPIDEADGIKEANLDVIPDDLSFDSETIQYALFDEGRE